MNREYFKATLKVPSITFNGETKTFNHFYYIEVYPETNEIIRSVCVHPGEGIYKCNDIGKDLNEEYSNNFELTPLPYFTYQKFQDVWDSPQYKVIRMD